MTKISEPNLCAFLDYVVGHPSLAAACRHIGISEKLIFSWLRKSSTGDPRFLVRWPTEEDEPRQFVECLTEARRQNVVLLESTYRMQAIHGVERVLVKDGKISWKEREDMVADGMLDADPETRLLLWGQRDCFERSPSGDRIPITITEPLASSLRIRMIEGLLPGQFGAKVEVTNHEGGRLVVGGGAPVALPAPTGSGTPVPDIKEAMTMSEDPTQDQPGDTAGTRELRRLLRERQAKGPVNGPVPHVASPPIDDPPPPPRQPLHGASYAPPEQPNPQARPAPQKLGPHHDVIPGGMKVR